MKPVINKDNIKSFAYVNTNELTDQPLAIVVEFRGLGSTMMYDTTERGVKFSDCNILYVIPYLNPWNWMNMESIIEIDEIIDVLKEMYNDPDLKVISTGMSMGGLCSLVYPFYAKHKVTAVVANCPVCDLPYHYTERPDLPRTMYSAFYRRSPANESIENILKKFSPLHLAKKNFLPKINYTIFHCTADEAVNIHMHSEKLVAELNRYHYVDFYKVEGMDHCDLGDELKHYEDTVIKEALKGTGYTYE